MVSIILPTKQPTEVRKAPFLMSFNVLSQLSALTSRPPHTQCPMSETAARTPPAHFSFTMQTDRGCLSFFKLDFYRRLATIFFFFFFCRWEYGFCSTVYVIKFSAFTFGWLKTRLDDFLWLYHRCFRNIVICRVTIYCMVAVCLAMTHYRCSIKEVYL